MDQEESRMIRKEREDEYREDARREEAEENACPCCGAQLRSSGPYYDEGRHVESGVSCKCGYARGESYGHAYLELPEGFIENDQGEIINTEETEGEDDDE